MLSETVRKTALEDASLQAIRSVEMSAKSGVLGASLKGSDSDFYDMLSRELWLATSKFTLRVIGYKVDDVHSMNLPHDAVMFGIEVQASDRTKTQIASHVVWKRCATPCVVRFLF